MPSPTPDLASEYPAPWSALAEFESESARQVRIKLEDPFSAAPRIKELMELSDAGDARAAYTLYSFGEFCGERGPWAVIPSFDQQDATAPKNWTSAQRESWMRTAARGGFWIAAFAALNLADALPIEDSRRGPLLDDALEGLEIAAHNGSLEALQSLADEFESGQRVPKDLPRAYAYLQVVAAAAPEGAEYWAERVKRLRPSISASDLRTVRVIQQDLAASLGARRSSR